MTTKFVGSIEEKITDKISEGALEKKLEFNIF
jgi:hypothetical protein